MPHPIPIRMKREGLPDSDWSNAGLLFDIGFKEWIQNDGERGERIGRHIEDVCRVAVPDIYRAAYKRWLGITQDDSRFVKWFGKLTNRLFIGLGGAHMLETQVTRHPVYGIPIIPGEAIKGLTRAWAAECGLNDEEADVLFGKTGETAESMDSGYLIFHDAWWVPIKGSKSVPYVREIVTVHAVEYYKTKGETSLHVDMESPNPNHQLAVQGSFYFVIEGLLSWATLGMDVLKSALEEVGIGGKVASGYGYFGEDAEARERAKIIAKEEREKRKYRAAQYRKKWEAEQKNRDIGEKPIPEQMKYKLEKALEAYRGKTAPLQQDRDELNRQVNAILEAGADWKGVEREAVRNTIRQCYELTLKAKQRHKKLRKLEQFINGERV